MSLSPAEQLAERWRQVAHDILDIRAHHRLRPHVFLEDKQELARKVFALADELKTLGRMPAKTATRFETGTIAGPSGRFVRVERRQRKAA